MLRHLLTLDDISTAELTAILKLASQIKAEVTRGVRQPYLAGKTLALMFEKPSLRTRISFEAGMVQLGGGTIFLGAEAGFGKRESTADFGRVLSSMVDAIAFRAKAHSSVIELAKWCSCPVINALTDAAHPCQALADMLTIQEHFGKTSGSLRGIKLAWVGDCNNVTACLIRGAAKLGMEMSIAAPAKYQFSETQIAQLVGNSPARGFAINITRDAQVAVSGAHTVYTDVWVSMGQEPEAAKRKRAFAAYQVNKSLMQHARRDAIFLHCLPAKRGWEVTDEVMDCPQSVIVAQAENRLHAQKGLLVWLLKNEK